jgi:hypothetical protein
VQFRSFPDFPAILPLCIRATTIYSRRFRAHSAIVGQWTFPDPEHGPLNNNGQTMIGRELYSIKEARELLGGISRNSIYELLRSGNLPSVVLGCRRFIAATAIAELIEKSTTRVSPSRDCARSRMSAQTHYPIHQGFEWCAGDRLRMRGGLLTSDPAVADASRLSPGSGEANA